MDTSIFYCVAKQFATLEAVPEGFHESTCRVLLSNARSNYIINTASHPLRQLFIPPSPEGTSFFASTTPVRDDFTSLSSFGSVDQFGQAGVLPKGSLQGTGVESTMLSSAAKNNAYYYQYTVSQPDQPVRRLYSVFALLPSESAAQGGAGMSLVSITGQCFESDVKEQGGVLEAIVESFKQK